MPFIDDGKKSKYKEKISKKEEKALKDKGYKAYDVRYGVSFPRGGKIKVWAKNRNDAHNVGYREQTNVMVSAPSWGHPIDVTTWKKSKPRMKRKNNPRFKAIKITKIHPKTGKKFTQTIYKHSKDWWKHPK